MPVTIRRASAADGREILACLEEAFELFRMAYAPEAFADTTLDSLALAARMKAMIVLVAIENDVVVGTLAYADVGGGEGHLRGMAVLPSAQGHGIADRLLAMAEDGLRALGCTRVTLDTTEPLLRAAKFYERNGFRRTGKISDYFGMRLIEWEKPITSSAASS
jgi:ribosomal protein S18 acetylase RimI-like enzyme